MLISHLFACVTDLTEMAFVWLEIPMLLRHMHRKLFSIFEVIKAFQTEDLHFVDVLHLLS